MNNAINIDEIYIPKQVLYSDLWALSKLVYAFLYSFSYNDVSNIKVIDIANTLKKKKSSISRCIKELKTKKFITKDKNIIKIAVNDKHLIRVHAKYIKELKNSNHIIKILMVLDKNKSLEKLTPADIMEAIGCRSKSTAIKYLNEFDNKKIISKVLYGRNRK